MVAQENDTIIIIKVVIIHWKIFCFVLVLENSKYVIAKAGIIRYAWSIFILNPIPTRKPASNKNFVLVVSIYLSKNIADKSKTKISCISIVLFLETATTIGVSEKNNEDNIAAKEFL